MNILVKALNFVIKFKEVILLAVATYYLYYYLKVEPAELNRAVAGIPYTLTSSQDENKNLKLLGVSGIKKCNYLLFETKSQKNEKFIHIADRKKLLSLLNFDKEKIIINVDKISISSFKINNSYSARNSNSDCKNNFYLWNKNGMLTIDIEKKQSHETKLNSDDSIVFVTREGKIIRKEEVYNLCNEFNKQKNGSLSSLYTLKNVAFNFNWKVFLLDCQFSKKDYTGTFHGNFVIDGKTGEVISKKFETVSNRYSLFGRPSDSSDLILQNNILNPEIERRDIFLILKAVNFKGKLVFASRLYPKGFPGYQVGKKLKIKFADFIPNFESGVLFLHTKGMLSFFLLSEENVTKEFEMYGTDISIDKFIAKRRIKESNKIFFQIYDNIVLTEDKIWSVMERFLP